MISNDLHKLDTCGCCKALVSPTPEEIKNRPGLASVKYRTGTYASFRQALIQAIAGMPKLINWTARTSDDYGIALIEMWAYLCDILTFYNERIANEAFLRTALLRESVLRMAAMLDYKPAPGLAASTYLAFILEENKQVKIPQGIRVQSIPGQDEKPQIFETLEGISADAKFNKVRIFPLPLYQNPLEQGSEKGILISDPQLISPGDRLVMFDAGWNETKEVKDVSQKDHQIILSWKPAIQSTGFHLFKVRIYKYVRKMRLFGYNAPKSFLKAKPKAPGSTEIIWKEETKETITMGGTTPPPSGYDLDSSYEDLKPGAQLLFVQGGEKRFSRLVTVTNVTQQAASQEPMQDTVTRVGLVRNLASTPPAVISSDSNNMYVFACGPENTLLYKGRYLIGNKWSEWSEWKSLGGLKSLRGLWTSGPAVVLNEYLGQFDIFVRGPNNALFRGSWDGIEDTKDTIDWIFLGGILTSEPAAIFRKPYFVDIFGRGKDKVLYQRSWDCKNKSWDDLKRFGGFFLTSGPAVIFNKNTFHIFVRGPNNALFRGSWNGIEDTIDWIFLGGILTSSPTAIFRKPNFIDIFAIGQDRALNQISWDCENKTWTDWKQLGGLLTSAPAAISLDQNHIEVFCRGKDNSLWHIKWDGNTWGPWESLGSGLGAIDDLRKVQIYELEGQEIHLCNRHYPDNIFGNTIYIPLNRLNGIDNKRTLILDDKESKPQKVVVTGSLSKDVDDDEKDDHLAITFTPALTRGLNTDTAVLYGNVAIATHGETITNEVLGNGEASREFQSFNVRKSPVTFIPKAGASHGAKNTLEIRVDGVLWQKVRNFYGHGSEEQIYTTSVDNDGVMTVQFGDGITGARLTTGRNNIAATYRQGLGAVGNIKTNSLNTLLDRPIGLKGVNNPGDAQGGADPETIEQARANAPNTVRTFDRIVSLRDFEDAAREFAGIAKARAVCIWDGEERVVCLTTAGDKGTPVVGLLRGNLKAYLDARRDPNRGLRLESYHQVPIRIEAAIKIDAKYNAEDVLIYSEKALRNYLAFENLDLGQAIHLSDIYSNLQNVKGVVSVDINVLQFKNPSDQKSHGADQKPVQGHLWVYPSELAFIEKPATDIIIILQKKSYE